MHVPRLKAQQAHPTANADPLLEWTGLIAEFRATRGELEAFTAYAEKPGYGRMMSELRRAAVKLKADPEDDASRELIERAGRALGVPAIDLHTLARVPADAVAAGKWRPRSVNVDLVEPDPTTRSGPESRFQRSLNNMSEKLLPGVKEVRVPGLHTAYRLASAFTPIVDAGGRLIADPIEAAGSVARSWSDATANEVQTHLRAVRAATAASELNVKEIRALPEIEQRMFLLAAESLSGMTLDAEQFISWARDPRPAPMPETLGQRLKRWTSTGLHALANFLRGTASAIRGVTDAEGWRTFAVHLQFGGGLEKWTVTTRAGVTLMFPTLEQVERDGHATVRIVSRLSPIETMFGGVTLTSRGGGLKFRAGPLGAKISEFEHEVKAGIPGIIGLSVGEDYAYGPSLAFGYSPPVGLLGWVPLPINIRVGGEVSVFHPALGPMAQGTRRMAEQISIACDQTAEGVRAVGRAVGLVRSSTTESQEGWPIRQRWNLARRVTERAEAAVSVARDRLERVKSISPERLVEVIGETRAQKLLGRHAATPAETHATIVQYLQSAIAAIERDSPRVREMAAGAISRKSYDKHELKALTETLRRHALAFEFVDVLLGELLQAEQLFVAELEPTARRGLRGPHLDRGPEARDESRDRSAT